MIKILKSKKGMTLIELVAGMMIFTIVATTVSAILVPMLKVYVSANELAECNTLLDNVANQIIKDLTSATVPLETDNALPVDDTISITVDNPKDVTYAVDSSGVLCYVNSAGDEIPVLSKTYYKNKNIKFTCESAEGGNVEAYTLTVFVLDKNDNEIIRREYAVRPLAIPENQY